MNRLRIVLKEPWQPAHTALNGQKL